METGQVQNSAIAASSEYLVRKRPWYKRVHLFSLLYLGHYSHDYILLGLNAWVTNFRNWSFRVQRQFEPWEGRHSSDVSMSFVTRSPTRLITVDSTTSMVTRLGVQKLMQSGSGCRSTWVKRKSWPKSPRRDATHMTSGWRHTRSPSATAHPTGTSSKWTQ